MYVEVQGPSHERGTYFGTRLGDRSKVVDRVSLGHTNTGIMGGEKLVLLVIADVICKASCPIRGQWHQSKTQSLSQRRVTDFVESIGTVGDEFPQEDLLVGVEGVYHRGQQWRRHDAARFAY